jgi:hypothetical protein
VPRELDADFDVAAALDAEAEFDFEALFAADDVPEAEAAPRARVGRHRVAFAVSITLAAIPLLVVDNFQATAEPSEGTRVEAAAHREDTDGVDRSHGAVAPTTSELAEATAPTVAQATVFVAQPTTTTAEEPAPTTTTTEKPAPTTTTTEKPAPKVAPTTTTAAPAVAAAPGSRPDPNSEATWDQLAECESGGNWRAVSDSRSGVRYYGGLQFSLATWEGMGGTGLPSDAPKATQIAMGKKLQARQGWDAWPSCARELGWS